MKMACIVDGLKVVSGYCGCNEKGGDKRVLHRWKANKKKKKTGEGAKQRSVGSLWTRKRTGAVERGSKGREKVEKKA